jgi:uncharacterized protein YrrD
MKNTREILGLSLICIAQGIEYGKIKGLLIDPDKGKVKYLIIDDGQWYLGAKLLSFDKVMGIGTDAITTEDQDNIMPFSQVEDALDLIQREVAIIGAKVYTQKGQYIGEIGEYYIDEQDGSIVGCELAGHQGSEMIPASNIVTYGKGVLVISDNIQGMLKKHPKEPADTADSESNGEVSGSFEQKQKQFLLGKKVTKRILNEAGEVLVDEGDIITHRVIDRVKAGGKLVELTMNIKTT